jgi:hypothetical protein
MLTPAQVEHYRTFGFVILRNHFTQAEVAALQREAAAELELQYRHMPFDGTRRHWCTMNHDERTPTFARLLEDERFFGVAEQLHGRALPVWCDANRYVDPETGWHPDIFGSADWNLRTAGVKFLHYLEPLTAATGALRVIPGSHRRPMHDAVRRYVEEHHPAVTALPAVACETRPGDVVAMNLPLWHAAAGASPDRSLCTVAYYAYPESAEDLGELQRAVRAQVPQSFESMNWRGDIFPREWIARAATDERRRRVVELIHSAGLFAVMGADVEAVEAALHAPAPSR